MANKAAASTRHTAMPVIRAASDTGLPHTVAYGRIPKHTSRPNSRPNRWAKLSTSEKTIPMKKKIPKTMESLARVAPGARSLFQRNTSTNTTARMANWDPEGPAWRHNNKSALKSFTWAIIRHGKVG